MDNKARKVIALPEYKGDLSGLFDFDHPMSDKEAFEFHQKHMRVLKKLRREFRKRYREEMSK